MGYYPLWAEDFSSAFMRMCILIGVGLLAAILANIGTATGTPALNVIAQIIDYILAIVLLINAFLMRTTLREKLGMPSSAVCDCLTVWCCSCCSWVQMGREVDVKTPWGMEEQQDGLDSRIQARGGGAGAPAAGMGVAVV